MRSPAAALAWEFHQRHRLGLIALFAYAVALVLIKLTVLEPGEPLNLDDSHALAAVVMVPLSTTFMYFLGVFSFGFDGDLTARQSMYPSRLFTLPITTRALAGWPMLYGVLAVAALLLGAASFVRWKTVGDLVLFDVQPWLAVPLLWPAALGAVFMAWTQVLTWMPYGLPGLRVVVAVFWLMTLDAAVIVALEYKVPDPVLVALLLPQLPLAYLAACFAVARARRGEAPDWRGVFTGLGGIASSLMSKRGHFASPAQAHLWFEWRRHGWSLPVWVGLLLPFELGLLFLARDEPEVLVFYTLLGVLLTPPVMASFVATTLSRPGTGARDDFGLSPFLATRPMTSVALIVPTLKAAMWSTLAAWGLVLLAIPLGLTWTGTLPVVIDWGSGMAEFFGPTRAVVVSGLILAGLMGWTWRRLVQRLCIGLTGRERLIKGTSFLSLSFLVVVAPFLQWLNDDSAARTAFLNGIPLILAVLVCVKVSAAAWIAMRLHDGRLIGQRALVGGAAAWLASVLILYALLVWFVQTPHIARYFLLLIAILQIPLARLSAAPLALAWNRHR